MKEGAGKQDDEADDAAAREMAASKGMLHGDGSDSDDSDVGFDADHEAVDQSEVAGVLVSAAATAQAHTPKADPWCLREHVAQRWNGVGGLWRQHARLMQRGLTRRAMR